MSIELTNLIPICSALAACEFSIRNRIKSILQTTHEVIGTHSIICYAYDRETGQLDILCMPGVTRREFMKGPTDKLVFYWDTASWRHGNIEKSSSIPSHTTILINSKQEYAQYLEYLQKEWKTRYSDGSHIPEVGGFRDREESNLAVMKIVLRKGIGQTNDPVGQIFYNFRNTKSGSDIFSETIKQQLESISLIVRELMIEMLYHGVSKGITFPKYSPESLLRHIDNAFIRHPGEDKNTLDKLEDAVATHICNAAKTVTANINGHADIVILDADTLGRTYAASPSPYASISPLQVILPDSLTGKCIKDRKYFIANDVHNVDRSSPEVQNALTKYNEFDRPFCKCIMLVPIVQDDGTVRAVLRLTSPEEGYFLDEQAKAIRDLEVFALQCLLRLDERRQRAGMNAALKFYAAAQSGPGWRYFPDLLREVASAFRAEWGTYWPIDPQQTDKLIVVGERGHRFSPRDIKEVETSDPECGIRTGKCAGSGISALTYTLNRQKKDGGLFVCVHVLKPHTQPNTSDAEYLLRFYSRGTFNGVLHEKCRKLTDDKDFWIAEWRQGEAIPVRSQVLNLNENTTRKTHSRVAFAVKEEGIIRAIVWLVFAGIHRIEWWERNYIDGFSTVLGRLEHNYSLQMIHRGFRHLIPGVCDEGSGRASMIHNWIEKEQERRKKKLFYERDRDKKQFDLYSLTSDIETTLACLHCKADEVKVLQHAGSGPDSGTDTLQSDTVEKYVNETIDIVSQFLERPEKFYKTLFTNDDNSLPDYKVPSIYLSVLWNLLDNAKRHGMEKMPKNERLAVIWIDDTNPEAVETVVANIGENKKDNKNSESQGGVGLSVVRILLRETGGRLDEWLDKKTLLSNISKRKKLSSTTKRRLLSELKKCNTFFSFQCPKIRLEV